MKEKIDIKYCVGCHDNFYNPNCWSRDSGEIVWRIMIGLWERPPYLNKKKKRVASCWYGIGNQREIAVKSEAIRADGYWNY